MLLLEEEIVEFFEEARRPLLLKLRISLPLGEFFELVWSHLLIWFVR